MIRERDWSGHPLGAPESWPEAFKVALSLVLNSPESMILAWGSDLHFFFNDTYFPFLGPRLSSAMGERFDKVWADGWAQAKPIIDEAFEGRSHRFVDLPWTLDTDRGARDTWWSFSYSRVLDADGAVAGLFIFTNETTDRVLGDAALRDSEARMRAVIEAAPIGLVFADASGRITGGNTRVEEIVGHKMLPSPNVEAYREWMSFHSDGRQVEGHEYPLAKVLSGEAEHPQLEVLYRRGDGRDVWIRFIASAVRDDEDRITGGVVASLDIDLERRGMEALAASEERYRTLFESIDVGFCVVEMKFDEAMRPIDYRLAEINPAFERQTGLHGSAGRWVSEVAPGLEGHWFETYGKVALTGEAVRFENRAEPFGRYYDVHAFRIGASHEHRVAILFNDITERRSAEDRLRELNETLEAEVATRTAERDRIWQVSSDMLGVADERGVWLSVNPAWTRVLGWRAKDIVGRTSEWMEHPDDLMKTRAEVGRLAAGATTFEFENRFRTQDGDYRTLSWTAVPEAGRLYCVTRDVTEERAQAAALAERTAERDRTWRLSRDMLVTADTDGAITATNAAWTDVLGWSEGEIVGRTFVDFTHPDDLEPTLAAFAGIIDEPLTTPYEYRFRHKDASYRWIAWTAAFEGGKVYASGRDVTAQKEQRAELDAAQEALRQSQKMEAVGQLTGGLAHDFNNLLAGISGSLELMATRIAQGRMADVDRYMIAAQGAAKRAAALTHRLLAFSRRQTLEPKPTDVNRLVADMEELIRRTVGPSIEVETVAKGGLWATLVDPNQLENALLNLCINARDAMPDGGRLTIETANRWLDERAARERDLPPGQYVSMCVSDNGTGMAPDVVERAFDPFFTTKPIGVGTGLGLSMIYGFARQSGGQVRIYSEVGQGTMVCVYLPRHLGEEAAPEDASDVREAPQAEAGETVLVIDDEPIVRMLVVDVLEDMGFTALEAGDGPQGLKILRSDARIDLLITDVGLPNGMNGRQVADAAREIRPGLKVLFVTGYAENAVLSHGHLDPGMQVVTKPFDMSVLASRIKAMVSGS